MFRVKLNVILKKAIHAAEMVNVFKRITSIGVNVSQEALANSVNFLNQNGKNSNS